MSANLRSLCADLVACAEKLQAENAYLRAAHAKVDRQLCDALDGIAEMKMKIKALEQLNEELRSLPIPSRTVSR